MSDLNIIKLETKLKTYAFICCYTYWRITGPQLEKKKREAFFSFLFSRSGSYASVFDWQMQLLNSEYLTWIPNPNNLASLKFVIFLRSHALHGFRKDGYTTMADLILIFFHETVVIILTLSCGDWHVGPLFYMPWPLSNHKEFVFIDYYWLSSQTSRLSGEKKERLTSPSVWDLCVFFL